MNYLLDTHSFLWMFSDFHFLSDCTQNIILDPDTELYLSKVTYWEICLKISIGKLKLMDEWQKKIQREINYNHIRWIQIAIEHCEILLDLPWIHRDPFDRMLISQAKCEDLTIITKDSLIQKYDVQTIW